MPNRACIFQNRSDEWQVETRTRSCCAIPARFSWYSIYSRLLAFLTIWSTWAFHASFDVNVTPNTLAWLTCSFPTLSIGILGIESVCPGSLHKQITISFVFGTLIFMRFSLVHFDIMFTDSCNSDVKFEVLAQRVWSLLLWTKRLHWTYV